MGSLYCNIWGVKYLFSVIDVFTKYAWVKNLRRVKKAAAVLNGFTEIVYEFTQKPN